MKKQVSKAKAAKIGKNTISIPKTCPFRANSSYAKVFAIIHRRKNGISKANLLEELKKYSDKDERLLSYDISVVASSSKEGSSHRSINRAADSYYILKENDYLKMVLR